MLILKRALAAGLLTGFGFAAAASPLSDIEAMLDKPTTLCGRFDQTKQLTRIKKPLRSQGRFCVRADGGVLWRTTKPFSNELRLTKDEIIQTQDGRVAVRLDAAKEPTVRVINNLLFSLLSGDLSALSRLFEVSANADAKTRRWRVDLTAKESGLARVLEGVSLDGGRYVERITLTEPNGDRTDIAFSDIKTGDSAMTPEEAAKFQ